MLWESIMNNATMHINDFSAVHVVSFSGGLTSARLVNLMEEKRINEGWNVYYVYMNTGAEPPRHMSS